MTVAFLGGALAIALLTWMAMTQLTPGSRAAPGEVPAIRTVLGRPPAPAAPVTPAAPVPGNTVPGSTSAPAPAQLPSGTSVQCTGTSPAEGYPGGAHSVQDPEDLASIKFCGGS